MEASQDSEFQMSRIKAADWLKLYSEYNSLDWYVFDVRCNLINIDWSVKNSLRIYFQRFDWSKNGIHRLRR